MDDKNLAPFGSWQSPITADRIVAGTIGVFEPAFSEDGNLYWLESRPQEGGRQVIVRRLPDGSSPDVNPPPFNARTRVHEYGGGSYIPGGGRIFFTNFTDQRLFVVGPDDSPRSITPEAPLRYADFVYDGRRNALFSVREDHRPEGEAVNTIVRIDAGGDEAGGEVLFSGHDFVASPRLSSDGRRLAWQAWNHPNMPWDGVELWVGELSTDGSLVDAWKIAGGPGESIFQPTWSPSGDLLYISDRSGWWNLYRRRGGRDEALAPMAADFGLPQWVFRMSTYAIIADGRLVCAFFRHGRQHLAVLDPASGRLDEIDVPFTNIFGVTADGHRVLFVGGSPTQFQSIVLLDMKTGRYDILRRSSDLELDEGYFSLPQAIEYPTENGRTAHAFYYPPRNKDFAAPAGEKPPLRVLSHGGPTSAALSTLNLGIQYWTSRGFAILDVNYGGSVGFGRAYRQRLNGQWGIVDVDDCINAARYLVRQEVVDPQRLAIAGGSAGGYTTLCALTFRDFFHAGASHFGVADAEALALDTHKFESRYLDSLFGPYPAMADLYRERSPIHAVHRLSCPIIFFQGLEDEVVPPSQSQLMFEAVRAKELPVAYLAFEGEQHGFRKAENIKRTLEGELYFLGQIFGFDPADKIEPVSIENL